MEVEWRHLTAAALNERAGAGAINQLLTGANRLPQRLNVAISPSTRSRQLPPYCCRYWC